MSLPIYVDLQVLQAIIRDKPDPLGSDLPAGLRALVEKALEKDPARRFQTTREMVADLKALLRNPAVTPGTGKMTSADLKRSVPTSRRHNGMAIAAVVAAVVVIGAGEWFSRGPSKPAAAPNPPVAEAAANGADPTFDIDKIQITKEDRLIVADFVNNAKDPVFDVTLLGALFDKLEQSDVVRPMSPGQVERLLEHMLEKPDARLTPELAKKVCIRSGEKAMLVGSIAGPLGNNYVLLLTATNCRTDEILATAQVQAEGKEKVLDALSQAVDDMRQKLGERLAELQKPGSDSVATTGSLEAYQAYAMGMELFRHGKQGEANAYFHKARVIDPKFARAWQVESETSAAAGRAAEGPDLLRKAYENRKFASEVERLMVEAKYAMWIERDLEKARRLFDEVLRLAPHHGQAQNELANIYAYLGNRKQSTNLHQQLLQDHPDFVLSYASLADDYVATDRFRDARRVLAMAGTQKLEIGDLHRRLLRIAYLEKDQAAIEKETPLAHPAVVRALQHDYAYATGRFREADALGNVWDDTSDPVRRRAFAEDCGALPGRGGSSFALLRCGERERAVQSAQQTLALPNLAQLDISIARAIASLGRGEPQKTVDELLPRVRVDSPPYLVLSTLGEAYMELNQFAEAVNVWKKVVSLRANLFQAGFPRAHVELARALKAAGKKADARKAYEAFFDLWVDADKDIPLWINAKNEYDALAMTN